MAGRLSTVRDIHLDLFRLDDDGASWRLDQTLTSLYEHPAHLLRLRDGRVLLTYGGRADACAVYARLSEDEGKRWQPPLALASYDSGDFGYPSSVQNEDGSIVTAYYTRQSKEHHRYHMGVVIWELEQTA